MIFLASLAIRAVIVALLLLAGIGSIELYGALFFGHYCVDYRDDGTRKRYVWTRFGKLPLWAACACVAAMVLAFLASAGWLAVLDISLND